MRPLNGWSPQWASTGVKEPAPPDTLNVIELVADTRDHGKITGDATTAGYDDARRRFEQPMVAGVDFDDVADPLEAEDPLPSQHCRSPLVPLVRPALTARLAMLPVLTRRSASHWS